MNPTHEMFLRSVYDSRREHERKIRNAGRLVLASVIIIPAIAALIYHFLR